MIPSSPSARAVRALSSAVFFLALVLGGTAWAQHPGGGGGGHQGGSGSENRGQNGGWPGPWAGGQGSRGGPGTAPMGNNSGALRGALQLAPPGRWWDDGQFARAVGLSRDQQLHMDDIFKQNKTILFKSYKTLQHEQSQLDKLSRARVLDEAAIDQQIDRVAQTRGELEKANAHMMIEIRKELSAEQNALLDEHRPAPTPSDE